MVEALYQVVGNSQDTFLDRTGGLVGVLSAWDAVTARIPVLWTKMATECGVTEDEYHSFLRWYGLDEKRTVVQNAYGEDEGTCEITS